MDERLARKRMNEVLNLVTSDVGSVRTGRATPSLVQDITISVYGGQQKLKVNELGTITSPDTDSIVIDPWDKSIIGEINKGIEAANVGLNPFIDGEIIRISIPPMTTEDRKKLVRLLGTKIENGKIMIRQIRGDFMKDIRHAFEDKEVSEDEKFNQEKRLQEITDKYIGKIEDVGGQKKQEIVGV